MNERRKAKHIEAVWTTYRAILPKTASATQIMETRRAFYAGAEAFYTITMSQVSAGTGDATEDDLNLMHDIRDELLAFAALVKSGAA